MDQRPVIRARSASPVDHYAGIALRSRIDGAGPHELVAILYDELLVAIDAMVGFFGRGDRAGHARSRSRALAALHGLSGGLDHERGGELASGLSAIYARAGAVVARHEMGADPSALVDVRTMIAEIAQAWAAIADRG